MSTCIWFDLLCLGLVKLLNYYSLLWIHLIYMYMYIYIYAWYSGLLHRYCGNQVIAPVTVNQSWILYAWRLVPKHKKAQREPCVQCLGCTVITNDVIISAMASQITGVSIVCVPVCSGAVQRKHISALLAFVRGIHWWPLNSLKKVH